MKTNIRRRSVASGFTLIELLLVLVILAVLAGIVVPKFANRTRQANETAAKSAISNLSTSIEVFETDNGTYPSKLEDLITRPGNADKWAGPYINQMPKDPWGNVYQYRYPGTVNPSGFDLYSFGADGREGNDDIWPTGTAAQ